MFLARDRIEKHVSEGKLIANHYHPGLVKQCSYDLRLGEQVYMVGKDAPEKLSHEYPYISIPPGQFALLTCLEELKMPEKVMGFIALRSTFKFQGLVNISGFHVDPTHEGTLLFAVQNVGPTDIRLKFAEPTFTIFFSEVTGDIMQSRADDKSTKFGPKLEGIRLQDVQILGGSNVTISKLQKEIEQLRFVVFVYTPLVVAILGTLIKVFWTK